MLSKFCTVTCSIRGIPTGLWNEKKNDRDVKIWSLCREMNIGTPKNLNFTPKSILFHLSLKIFQSYNSTGHNGERKASTVRKSHDPSQVPELWDLEYTAQTTSYTTHHKTIEKPLSIGSNWKCHNHLASLVRLPCPLQSANSLILSRWILMNIPYFKSNK